MVVGDEAKRLVARRRIEAGDPILTLHGVLVPQPSRHTLQVGCDVHLAPAGDGSAAPATDEFAWCYLDHACRPNARVLGRTLLALRAIDVGEAITFDYTTTEWDMASPFVCGCGAPDCIRIVQGFARLNAAQRLVRRDVIALHVRERANEQEWIGTGESP